MGNSGQIGHKDQQSEDENSEQDHDEERQVGAAGPKAQQTMSVFQGDAASQELIIENLENLEDTAALIVTREGGQFKIGIQQDATTTSITASMGEKADTVSSNR